MKSAVLAAVAAVAVGLGYGAPSSRAQERYDDRPPAHRFAIAIGGFLMQDFDTTVRFDSKRVPIGTVINLEDKLEVDSDIRVARIDGFYRFNKKHRIHFGWFSANRSGDTEVIEQIRIGDPESGEEIIIEPGARVLSRWSFDVFNLDYQWSFLNTRRYELYLGGGFNFRNLTIDFVGDFDPGDGVPREDQVNAKGLLPLPVLAFGGRWNFSQKWLSAWRWQWLAIKIGEYQGTIRDMVLVFENDTFKNVGFGFGLNSYELNVTAEGEQLRGQLDESYLGFLFYVKVYF